MAAITRRKDKSLAPQLGLRSLLENVSTDDSLVLNRYIEEIPTKRVTRYGESFKKVSNDLERKGKRYGKNSTFDVLSTSDYSSAGSSQLSSKRRAGGRTESTSPLSSHSDVFSYKHLSSPEDKLTDINVQSVQENDWDSDVDCYQDAQNWEIQADFQHYDQIKGHTIVADNVYLLIPHESINCQDVKPSDFSISTQCSQGLTLSCQLYKTLHIINISPIVQISPTAPLFSARHPAYVFIPLTYQLDSECRTKVSCLASSSSSSLEKVEWRRVDSSCYRLSDCNNYLIVRTCVLGFFAVIFEEDAQFFCKKIRRRIGGELNLNSVKISFPKGSCSEDIEARVKILHDKEPPNPGNVFVPGVLACPIVMLSPGGYNFSKNVTIELPVPNYHLVKEIEPKAELKVYQSCTRNGEPLNWKEHEPNKTSLNKYKNGLVTFSFTVSHFSFFKIFWDIMSKNIQKFGYLSSWIAFPLRCEAFMEENKETNTFGLDIACFNPEKTEEFQRSTYKYKVGSSLKPKLVKPGNILCKLNSQKFRPDTEAGEDDVMEKMEENFRGDDFNKQFALMFNEKLRVERGTFGKVIVDRVDCDRNKLESLFELNLTKQGIETEARPRHSDVWSMIALKELASNLYLTDDNNWKKFAAYIGCTRLEIDFITRTKGDPFVEMMKQYQERGGTAEDFVQSLYSVSRDLNISNAYNSSAALPSSPGSASSSGVSGSGSQNSQHSQGGQANSAANITKKFSFLNFLPRMTEDSDSGTADHHQDLTPSTKVNTSPCSSKESRKRSLVCEKTPSLSKRRKTDRSPVSRLNSHRNDSYSSSDESGAEPDLTTKAKTISTERHTRNMYRFTDQDLWKVSSEMASINWRALGRTLGLEEAMLVNLEHSHKSNGMKECVYQMLREWKEKKPKTCTFGSLYAALTTEKMNGIAKNLVKLLEEGNFKK